ncbi:MAG: CBS domain-containing protein [Acidobacteriota bacterium]
MSIPVSQVMSSRLVTVGPDDNLGQVRDLFELHGFHHLLVMDEDRLVGVLSDRDLLRGLSPFVGATIERQRDADTLRKRVHQVMRRHPISVGPDHDLAFVAQVMLSQNVSCLPVLGDSGEPLGIVTSRDLLRQLVTSSPALPTPV